jgi:lysophospholipase L1-like esterase
VARLGGFLAVLAAVLALGPATGAASPAVLTLHYKVPPRYGLDQDHDGLVDSVTTTAQVSPATWTALVTVRWPSGGPCLGTYRWTIDGKPATFIRQRNATGLPTCTFASAGFTRLDHPYRVRALATRLGASGTGQTTVTIRDLLVVGLGDSTASGEGNPDHGVAFVRWQDRRCHRSAKGFEAQVAASLEAASAKTSVTFVPLACSGASIPTGMIGPYAGIAPSRGATLPPQVDAMKTLIGSRRVDAVIVSIGINDVGFGNIARFCFDDGLDAQDSAAIDCWNKPYPAASSPTTLQDWVRTRRAALPGRYAQLAAAFRAAGIPASKIYVTEYPNATRDAQGATCSPLIPYLDSTPFGYSVRGTITGAEAAQAESELLLPVNAALKAAAATYGWHVVSGIASQSTTHGVCSTRPWFVDVSESLIQQHDVLGTLHPNLQGQQAIAGLVVSALKK